MRHKPQARVIAILLLLAVLCLLTGCAPTPQNADVESAIKRALAQEKDPPEMNFSGMSVPTRYAGKALAVVESADGVWQRGYVISYDKIARGFVATLDYEKRPDHAPMRYSAKKDENSEQLSSFYFDFSDNREAEYLLLYAGEGADLGALRAAFEREHLQDFPDEVRASFEVCDLGGNTLILLVPHYEDTAVWINKIEVAGDALVSGDEIARFEDSMPVYIYCRFGDRLPGCEIHVSQDGAESFFTANEALLKSIKSFDSDD